jgi:hypothetical protein
VIVLDIGRLHQHGEPRARRLGDEGTLATFHPLGRVKPAWTAAFCCFYALAIDNAGREDGMRPAAMRTRSNECKIDPTPDISVAPTVEKY